MSIGKSGVKHFEFENKKIHFARPNVHEPYFSEKLLMQNEEYNRTTSRFEAHLMYKHTQKPDFLISNAR